MNGLFLLNQDFIEALNLAWQGMLIIFLTMAIIFFAIWLLSKIKTKKQ